MKTFTSLYMPIQLFLRMISQQNIHFQSYQSAEGKEFISVELLSTLSIFTYDSFFKYNKKF